MAFGGVVEIILRVPETDHIHSLGISISRPLT
jgi:hypothetical protein